MAIYMIGYDLHRSEGANYDRLFAALETMGRGYWDCLDSTWLVMTEKTPTEIRDELNSISRTTTGFWSCDMEKEPRGSVLRTSVRLGSRINCEAGSHRGVTNNRDCVHEAIQLPVTSRHSRY